MRLEQAVDLHTHTNASDGTYSPSELVDYAIAKELAAIAITDHDTIAGLAEAKNRAFGTSLEIISGIEFSSVSDLCPNDLHILGLCINENDLAFTGRLAAIVDERNTRNGRMVGKLRDHGFDITLEDIRAQSSDGVITRAHFGRALMEKGYVASISEAFDKYIGYRGPCYVEREKLTPEKAIEMILANGGVPVLAHPTLYGLDLVSLEKVVEHLARHGLIGIEGIYSTYTKSETRWIGEMAKRHGLLCTGGSDFHGANKNGIDLGVGYGSLHVPASILDAVKEKSRNCSRKC